MRPTIEIETIAIIGVALRVRATISKIWSETLNPVASRAELGRLAVTLALLAAAAKPHFPARRMARPLGSAA